MRFFRQEPSLPTEDLRDPPGLNVFEGSSGPKHVPAYPLERRVKRFDSVAKEFFVPENLAEEPVVPSAVSRFCAVVWVVVIGPDPMEKGLSNVVHVLGLLEDTCDKCRATSW